MTSVSNTNLVRVFIGYDPREIVALNVLAHSLVEQSSCPVSITPIRLSQLRAVFDRPANPLQSTEFSFSRFLTPYLSDYSGWSIFMDCDMLARGDIAELWAMRDADYAVQVVKHEHVPLESTKFLDQPQTPYAKKNWSSVMLFNNEKCRALTPAYVNSASGLELHQFKWLESEDQIGELPRQWNHLIGYNPMDPTARIVHFTIGGPYFVEYAECDYAEEWRSMRDRMLSCQQRATGPA
jgi:lipopolysaccharide biosynthesis glycosyltransferase